MKRMISLSLVTIIGFAVVPRIAVAVGVSPSTAERSVEEARKSISDRPTQFQGYNLLAEALLRRAQETSDVKFCFQAETAIKKSLELFPNNFESEKIRVSILLEEREFPAALEAAQKLNKQVPDDVMVYGMLTDADIELGNYNDAEIAAQWMLNLRPGNLPALTRAARLRQLFGESEGAYELMEMAYESTSPDEPLERASILTQMAHNRLAAGRTDAAEKLLQQALESVPAYPSALGGLAQVRTLQHRLDEAIALLKQRYQMVPRAENLFEIAAALQLAGQNGEAMRTFSDFESKALQESSAQCNSNRDLVFYYADQARQPVKALEVAKREIAWRHDINTLDAYAWALHVNGQDTEARKEIESALAVGIQDSEVLRHAGEIVLKLGDTQAAKRYFSSSIELAPQDSDHARTLLASISQPGSR